MSDELDLVFGLRLMAEIALWEAFAPSLGNSIVVLGHKCSDVGCVEVARWTCYWPGQTLPKCTSHRDRWAHVAGHMGFELHSSPLIVREWPEPDPSSERFAAMEID